MELDWTENWSGRQCGRHLAVSQSTTLGPELFRWVPTTAANVSEGHRIGSHPVANGSQRVSGGQRDATEGPMVDVHHVIVQRPRSCRTTQWGDGSCCLDRPCCIHDRGGSTVAAATATVTTFHWGCSHPIRRAEDHRPPAGWHDAAMPLAWARAGCRHPWQPPAPHPARWPQHHCHAPA